MLCAVASSQATLFAFTVCCGVKLSSLLFIYQANIVVYSNCTVIFLGLKMRYISLYLVTINSNVYFLMKFRKTSFKFLPPFTFPVFTNFNAVKKESSYHASSYTPYMHAIYVCCRIEKVIILLYFLKMMQRTINSLLFQMIVMNWNNCKNV